MGCTSLGIRFFCEVCWKYIRLMEVTWTSICFDAEPLDPRDKMSYHRSLLVIDKGPSDIVSYRDL